jgi:hypothetical protein
MRTPWPLMKIDRPQMIYRQCRRKYHYAIRALKKEEQQSRMNRLAENMTNNKTRDLWTELKKDTWSFQSVATSY